MAAQTFQPIPPRPAPVNTEGPIAWLRANLFGDWRTTLSTLLVGGLLLWYMPQFLQWAVFKAMWLPDEDACRAEGVGACWGVVAEKYRLIIFGRYPFDQQWRPLVATALMVALLVASCTRPLWRPWLAIVWVVVLTAFFLLMYGGAFGLVKVDTDRWGGLPLTILLASMAIVLAFPIALVVALGRRSNLPAIRTACIVYVELVRGVPLISVLFMASFMFPLFMPEGISIDVLVRALAGITLFAAAYMAEVIRGGLQAVPRGQFEAADALGLSYPQKMGLIVLPQALKIVIPGIVNTFIGLFKDTSLVLIIGIFDLLGMVQVGMSAQRWLSPATPMTGYVFTGVVFWIFCFGISRYSQMLERRLAAGGERVVAKAAYD